MRKSLIVVVVILATALNSMAQTFKSTYAIQNIQSGKNIRPYDAGSQDGNRIVLYSHVDWKCMTWQFIKKEGDTYQLKNLFTSKTLHPASKIVPGVSLEQTPLKDEKDQCWEFIGQGENSYFIRLKDTDLYITTSSDATNSAIILQPKQPQSTSQLWRLVEQHPTM